MTKQHDIAYYKDGFVPVAYCKRCSAEGEKLLEDCDLMNLPGYAYCHDMGNKAEEELKIPLDDKKPTAK